LYILPAGIFLLFDLGVPSLAAQLKAQGEYGLPARQKGGAAKVRRVVAWSVFNVLLGVAIQAGLEWLVTDVLHFRSLLLIKGSKWTLNHLPNPWTLVKHTFLGLILRNVSSTLPFKIARICLTVAQVFQYYIHQRILHDPNGNPLADLHQCWHHSIRTPYSFVAAYDHPVCYLLHRFLPLYLPAIAFRFHIMTYLLLLAIFSLEELFTYSGYNVLPSTIMLRGMARRVDAHMLSEGNGNFGPLGVLDWVHGTTLGRDVMDDLKAEMDKHDVQERSGQALEDAGNKANGAANGLASKMKGRARKGRG
jgi:hypothetical protein